MFFKSGYFDRKLTTAFLFRLQLILVMRQLCVLFLMIATFRLQLFGNVFDFDFKCLHMLDFSTQFFFQRIFYLPENRKKRIYLGVSIGNNKNPFTNTSLATLLWF